MAEPHDSGTGCPHCGAPGQRVSRRVYSRQRRLARISEARSAYIAEKDEWVAVERLREYESALASHLGLEELDWTICFACGYEVVRDGKLNGRGQWFGSWSGYALAMLCSHCAPKPGPVAFREERSG